MRAVVGVAGLWFGSDFMSKLLEYGGAMQFRKILAVFCLVACSISVVYAEQSKQFAQAGVKGKSIKNKQYDSNPFDFNKINFKNYFGHDAVAIYKAIQRQPVKDEYETSENFGLRIKQWSEKPLYNDVRIGDSVAFVAPTFQFLLTFDADKELLKVDLSDLSMDGWVDSSPFVRLDGKERKAYKSGVTRMGVRFKYEERKVELFGLWLKGESLLNEYEFKISLENARKVKEGGFLIFIGPLYLPYTQHDFRSKTASLDSPVDIEADADGLLLELESLLVVDAEGQVVQKISIDEYAQEKARKAEEEELNQVMQMVRSKLPNVGVADFRSVKKNKAGYCGLVTHDKKDEVFYVIAGDVYIDSLNYNLARKFCADAGWRAE